MNNNKNDQSINSIETFGVEQIPDHARTATPRDLFQMIFGGSNTFWFVHDSSADRVHLWLPLPAVGQQDRRVERQPVIPARHLRLRLSIRHQLCRQRQPRQRRLLGSLYRLCIGGHEQPDFLWRVPRRLVALHTPRHVENQNNAGRDHRSGCHADSISVWPGIGDPRRQDNKAADTATLRQTV